MALLFWLAIGLIVWLLFFADKNPKISFPYSFSLVFAGNNPTDACNGVGQALTAYASSTPIVADVYLYTTNQGTTPVEDGQYAYQAQGSRLIVSGGLGKVDQIVGCA